MKTVRYFSLVRPAKGSGGDRYEASTNNSKDSEEMTIYVPQSISRRKGSPTQKLTVTIDDELD